jgi:hypothetical protein
MTGAHRLHRAIPELDAPVLVVMLTGWIDASGAAAAAMGVIESECRAELLASFDDDVFIDYRARRPTMELREGVNTRLVWNVPELKVGRDLGGRDVLLLTGPEPDTAWRRFADEVGELALSLGVRQMVGLGAYPYAAPHTRPPQLSCTSPSASVVASVPYLATTIDVPAGAAALLEHALHDRGIPAIGLWVQVPHYVASMAYPASSVTLLGALREAAGVVVDGSALRREAILQRERLDQLVAANEEHRAMLRQLEEAFDADVESRHAPEAPPQRIDAEHLPSGDELAAELERFLRDQHPDS